MRNVVKGQSKRKNEGKILPLEKGEIFTHGEKKKGTRRAKRKFDLKLT